MNIKTGILGGTFNPVHNAHLSMAQIALGQAELEEVWLMPSHNPPHKPGIRLASGHDRSIMLQLGIASCHDVRILFSDYELRRKGLTYTAQTLERLRTEYPDRSFYFIMGGDSFLQLETWYLPEKIMQYAEILAFGRSGAPDDAMQKQKNNLEEKYRARIQLLSMPTWNISSREIRKKIAAGEDVTDCVPENVIRYIKQYHLYQEE